MPTKLPAQLNMRKYNGNLMGEDNDREIIHLLSSYAKPT